MHQAGVLFRQLVATQKPLTIVGTINAYHARLAQAVGHQAIYLSGGGVAACMGLPDLGITQLHDVLIDAERIINRCDLPLLVDIDTGFGLSALNIARSIRSLERIGVAAIHIEDQAGAKRCGHRPNKQLVSTQEMCARIKACVDARSNEAFVIMARTDALASEGLEAAIMRANAYLAAGADMIFAEAITELHQYQQFRQHVHAPILANITEFGKTPLFSQQELATLGIDMVLYPLSAFRAMNHAAQQVYRHILHDGTQQAMLKHMQTRDELYHHLNYHEFEALIDQTNISQQD